ncbi:MAG: hypothetical protein M1812_007242 [Candelaria pacifica]|nr:MAG: hypothetical protein M1812_007242 [Candelaria pacifica]
MAFHAPANLQNLASLTTDLLPSFKNAISIPWRAFTQSTSPSNSLVSARPSTGVASQENQQRTAIGNTPTLSKAVLPECLQSVPIVALRPQIAMFESSRQVGLQHMLSTFNRSTLSAANPVARSIPSGLRATRAFSTLPLFRFYRPNQRPNQNYVGSFQRRTLFGGNSSQNLLAHMEQTANNNPQSATAQNAFYTALLRANMSDIIVERYQTGRYATNPACEATYLKALDKVGQTEGATTIAGTRSGNFNNEQIQAIGQAVAAQSRGSNIAMSRGKSGSTGTGAKESPLYVVVEESVGGSIFKWAKFLFYFALVSYLSLVLLTMLVETTGLLKRIGGAKNNEAKAEHQTVKFSDVQGCDEAKEELQDIVDFLKNPEKFSTLGGKLPKGVLLVGPPGTGKTLLARAIAGEAGVPFFFMSGSEFDEVYVGVGAKRVRELFSAARAKAPAIVFIDELDAIGGKRNERDAAYAKQTLNQLLTDLDGFSQTSGVIFVAATNFPKLLDKALVRPGRFDRKIDVGLPDVRGRVAILKHHMRNIQAGPDVDTSLLARGTPGFSGAELENIVNQAAVRASKLKLQAVSMHEFEWAKDRIVMGAERRSMILQQKDKVMTAYHEGGHALVALFTAGSIPLYKATIMPRGQALGVTISLPEIDQVSMAKLEYQAMIDVCMGGKVAEELVYGADNVSSGVSNDLQRATSVAQAMVTQLGMSELLGNVDLESNYSRLSSETKQQIESEVRRILEEGKDRVTKLLASKRKELDLLANALVEHEMLNKDEIEKVIRGEKLPDRLTSMPTGGMPLKLPEALLPPRMSRESGTESSGDESPKPGGAELS